MTPAILTAETEAEFAAALDQAIATGLPVQAPAEVCARFGLDEQHGPDSAEAEDVRDRPWIALVSGSENSSNHVTPCATLRT